MIPSKRQKRIIRHRRVRAKIQGSKDRPRLSVFRSQKNIFLQLIDDSVGKTLASASSREVKGEKTKGDRAKAAAELLGQRALAIGIKQAVFDRGGYKYHGRVKLVAETLKGAGVRI